MRQQLTSWLIEDIAPEIRRNHNPEGTILKFAHEKNLEPALVQGLGQLYNTAKTLAFMEKHANRGASFPLLDVDKMVDKYLEVRPKEAGLRANLKGSVCAFDTLGGNEWNQDWTTTGLPDCFKNVPGMKYETETYEEQPQKSAAAEAMRTADEKQILLQQLDQAVSEFREDAREILTKMAKTIKQDEIDFEAFERDALQVYGDIIKPAADLLADHCQAVHVKVARAADAGTHRLVMGNEALLKQLDEVSTCLFKIATGKEMQAQVQAEEPAADQAPKPSPAGIPEWTGGPALTKKELADKQPKTDGAKSDKKPKSPSGGGKPDESKSILDMPFTSGVSKLHGGMQDFLGTGYNAEQQLVDDSYNDAKHMALLQNLLTTDDVLADADHEKVVSLYNTLRHAAPSIAGDPNTVRVALRSMVQHDGVSPFDLKGLLDTEGAKQKTVYNKKLDDEMSYGGAGFKPTPSPRPMN